MISALTAVAPNTTPYMAFYLNFMRHYEPEVMSLGILLLENVAEA